MTDHRRTLANLLRHVIDGGDLTWEKLTASVPDPKSLKGAQMKAWFGLSYWTDDADIRAKDSDYGSSRRRQLAKLLSDLENS